MRIHHLGFLVKSIAEFESNLLFKEKVRQVYDPVQKASLALYQSHGQPYLELIEPQHEEAFTYRMLQQRGEGFHHLCYQLGSEEQLQQLAESQLWLPIQGPLPAVLFNDSPVYFYMDRNRQIVEVLLESEA